MNNNKKFAWLYIVLTVVISCAAAVFQYITNNNYIDAETGFYKIGGVTPEALSIFMAVSLLLILTSAFVMHMDSLPRDIKRGSVWTGIGSCFAAVLIIFSTVMFFVSNKGMIFSGGALGTAFKLRIACSVLSVPAAIYFIVVAFSGSLKNKVQSVLSFFPLLWTLVYLMSVYFDQTTYINTPIRTIQQVALIALMLYQLFETRAMLGISKPYFQFMLSNASTLLLSAVFIPQIIDFFNGKAELNAQTGYAMFFAGMTVYVVFRSIDFAIDCGGGKKTSVKQKSHAKDDIFSTDDELA